MEKKINQIKSSLIKIVLFGPESTGKSTLSNALAKHYKSVCVPEYARDFLQSKWDMYRKTCEKKDLWAIAKGQEKLENEISKKANRVLFCDTNLLQTKLYSEIYYEGYCDPRIEKSAKENYYDLIYSNFQEVGNELLKLYDANAILIYENEMKLGQMEAVKYLMEKTQTFKVCWFES